MFFTFLQIFRIIDRPVSTRFLFMCARVVDKAKKRRQILEAARDVFSRQGIYNFKMIDIAKRAEIGKGTLYEYFRDKEDLIAGVFNNFLREVNHYVEQQMKLDENPRDQIKTYLATSLGYFEKYPENLHLVFDLWSKIIKQQGNVTSTLEVFSEDYRTLIGKIADVIRCGQERREFKTIDSQTVASALMAYVEGIMFQVVIGVYKLDSRKTADEVSRIFFEGIGK